MKSTYLIRIDVTTPANKAIKLSFGSGAFPHQLVVPANSTESVYFNYLTRKHVQVLKTAAQQGCTLTLYLAGSQQ